MRDRTRQTLNIVFAVLQLITNGIGGAGALGFIDVGSVSDKFFTYFIPAGYTFAVWGPIYFGLTAYAIYQALPGQTTREVHRRVGWIAAAVAFGNAIWTPIFIILGANPSAANILPALVVIALMLVGLATIFVRLRQLEGSLTRADRWLVQVPFSGYFAWITAATVLNAIIALMTLGQPTAFLGISGAVWSAILQAVTVLIAGGMIFLSAGNHGTVAYTAVLIWAFVGVYVGNSPRAAVAGYAALAAVVLIVAFAVLRLIRSVHTPAANTVQAA
ncbi:MAG: hypothetical protein ACOYL5_20120 [Phototrophicaceae bacterium]|jgi:hypothetical protein